MKLRSRFLIAPWLIYQDKRLLVIEPKISVENQDYARVWYHRCHNKNSCNYCCSYLNLNVRMHFDSLNSSDMYQSVCITSYNTLATSFMNVHLVKPEMSSGFFNTLFHVSKSVLLQTFGLRQRF